MSVRCLDVKTSLGLITAKNWLSEFRANDICGLDLEPGKFGWLGQNRMVPRGLIEVMDFKSLQTIYRIDSYAS